jgi:chemotaxis protein CheX
MSENINYQDLVRQYGLEAIPDSVVSITRILSKQDADIDEIARIISKDPALTKRMLRAANPGAKSEGEYDIETVDAALMRNGLGCALLLAMGTPLAHALVKTFQVMLNLRLESTDLRGAVPPPGKYVLGTIGFSGKAAGVVHLRLSLESATAVAARILGLQPQDITNAGEINDAVGELLNIVAGNFKSNLCDAGLDCSLQPPQVMQTSDASMRRIPNGSLEQMAFRAGPIGVFVEVQVNPWNAP